ncbi:MAG: 3-dehydroquinate synthase [Actinomycetaceae bacterium]|nr:3-dehydroquinate synthase [Actinomycetaceae bacterium]
MSVKAVFIGMPGAGKTTVGGLVAQALGCEFKDSDDLIEETEGRTIPEIFAADGEKGFRAIEARVIQDALVGYDGVLSLGGGAVLTASTREALAGHPVFLLNADNDELVRRLTSSSIIRPLVRDDPEGRVATLRREREDLYRASARYTVESDGRPARRVARKVLSIIDQLEQLVVEVEDEPTGYDVVVGTGLGRDLRVACQGAGSIFVCYAPEVAKRKDEVMEILGHDHEVISFELPSGEEAKSYESITRLWNAFGEAKLGRDGLIVAIGGGATTDSVGFAASTWLRGVPLVLVPTTLLGMVDTAIGSKTGVNTPSGTNLVGSFYTPIEVLCDLGHLEGLPERELRSGLAEIIKYGFIADRRILEIVESAGSEILDHRAQPLRDAIERSIRVKADIVSSDPHEEGRREVLNYGHTLGHAIEACDPQEIRHGEAVSIGCVFAAVLAESAGVAPKGWAEEHRRVFAANGLPVEFPHGDRAALEEAMTVDKKVRDHQQRFVVLADYGRPQVLTNPAAEHIDAAFAAIGM